MSGAGEGHALPDDDQWPPEQDVFWRVVKSMLPPDTLLTVRQTAFGAYEATAWGSVDLDLDVALVAVQVPPSMVTDPPMASTVGRSLAERLG